MSIEVCERIDSFSSWERFKEGNPLFFDDAYLAEVSQRICENGALEPITNFLIGPNILSTDGGLREGLNYDHINSRIRAVMLTIAWQISDAGLPFPKIYAAEAVTPFALKMRGTYSRFIGSEYAVSEEQREDLFPILSEDLLNLSYPRNSFDIVSTNEVLEHVPSVNGALAEIYRVLKPGGWHIGTLPFLYGQEAPIVRAKLENGELVHLTEPEYHGNPVDEKGSLVFELPGWSILDHAREIGFSDAHMKYILSERYGCISETIGGILVLCLQK